MGRWSQASMSQASWARASREWHGLPNPRQRTRNWGACMPSASSASFNRPDENPGHEEEKRVPVFAFSFQITVRKRHGKGTRGNGLTLTLVGPVALPELLHGAL